MENFSQVKILIVAKAPDSVQQLSQILVAEGFQVCPVSNGKKALEAAQATAPDLIVLDMLLPDIDSYTLCEQFKADDRLGDVPVLFMRALNEPFDKLRAFAVGGVDYVTKPFEAEEVLARVRTYGRLRLMQRQLYQQHQQLQQEMAARKQAETALKEANTTKDTFLSILAHDLRSPFSGVFGSVDFALRYFDELDPDELREHLQRIKKSADMFYALLENLLIWSRIERGKMEYQPENIPVHELIVHLIEQFTEPAKSKQITFRHTIPDSLSLSADIAMLSTILRNLISNGIKFTPPGGTITLTASACENEVRIAVADTGVGIPDTVLPDLLRIDRKTVTLGTADEHGTGLGLPLCANLVKKNHGSLAIQSVLNQGTTVTITLPASASRSAVQSFQQGLNQEDLIKTLRACPRNWQFDLLDAVEAFNLTQTRTLIEAIRPEHQMLADTLMQHADLFQFEALQALCHVAVNAEERGYE